MADKRDDQQSEESSGWSSTINKVLIGIGVLAFSLIIADRMVNMIKAEDVPDLVEIKRDVDAMAVTENDTVATSSVPDTKQLTKNNGGSTTSKRPELNDVFGSRLVFVSESESPYVVTADERRIGIGEAVDDNTILAGVTQGQVIVERSGNRLTFDLPEPTAQ